MVVQIMVVIIVYKLDNSGQANHLQLADPPLFWSVERKKEHDISIYKLSVEIIELKNYYIFMLL
jgi:hypothetical protein